jgi:predicted RNA binding protein YcfA (HicA-like mRNA interferase family)
MSSVPAVSGKDALRSLRNLGFRLDRIEGSHHIMVRDDHPFSIPVPIHGSSTLPKGTLASIIRMSRAGRRKFFHALNNG